MAGIFGDIDNPLDKVGSGGYGDVNTGLPSFISNVVTILFVAGGLFTFFNLIFAGYAYLSAAGDKQKLEKALSSINMSLVGLVIMVGASILVSIISFLLFNDAGAILSPKLLGPGSISN